MRTAVLRFVTVAIAMGCAGGAAVGAEPRGVGRAEPVAPVDFDAMVVHGAPAKPQVFYVIGRSRVDFEKLKEQRTFTGRIVDTAKQNPF